MIDLLKMKKNNIRNQSQMSRNHIKEKVASWPLKPSIYSFFRGEKWVCNTGSFITCIEHRRAVVLFGFSGHDATFSLMWLRDICDWFLILFFAFTLVPNIRMNHRWYHHTIVYNSNLVFVMIFHQKVINGKELRQSSLKIHKKNVVLRFGSIHAIMH
jgi:hypothetical protein